MYNRPFLIPNYAMIPATQKIPIFNKINNIFKGIKTFNWTGLINNTSKTLGIINQSIPIVKQVGPVFGNMKSMIKLASAFKDETDITPSTYQNNNSQTYDNTTNTESPTFFIN